MLTLYKGNLYNRLAHKLDSNLIDSDQYDLQITDDQKSASYRIRYRIGEDLAPIFTATKIDISHLIKPRFNKYGVPIEEIQSFLQAREKRRVELNPSFKVKIDKKISDMRKVPDYYAFLQRVTAKNTIRKSQMLYNFSIPAMGARAEQGILSYDLEIELVHDWYYVITYIGNVEKGYIQRREPQYMIYDKPGWNRAKTAIDEETLDLAVDMNSPLNLTEYIMIMTGGNRPLTIEFLRHLRNSKTLLELCHSPFYSIIKVNLDEIFKRELELFMKCEQEDINYDYKRLSLTRISKY